ncbi:MAG: glycosyltransferase [Acidobacteria bacterium]|nr:MAG: glycosyltransferase [Acidobacteriota bacterium]
MVELMPRRVMVVGSVPPPVHGSSVMAERLLDALEMLGVESILVDKKLSFSIDEIGGGSIRKAGRAARFVNRVGKAVPDGSPLCIYFLTCAPGSFLVDCLALYRLRRRRARIVPYLHGIGFQTLAAKGRLWRWMVAWSFGVAERVVILGRSAYQDVRPWVDESSVFVVPNAVPPPPPGALRGRTRHGSSDDETRRTRFLYFATLDPEKGAREFLLAARHCRHAGLDADFIVAGQSVDEAYTEDLRSLAQSPELAGRVRMTGGVFGEAKAALFREADVFVFPTRYRHENFPLVNLEAMSFGLPVISTRRGCIPEQVPHGKAGLIADSNAPDALADLMLAVARSAKLRARLSRGAKELYEAEYTPEAFAERWREVLHECYNAG